MRKLVLIFLFLTIPAFAQTSQQHPNGSVYVLVQEDSNGVQDIQIFDMDSRGGRSTKVYQGAVGTSVIADMVALGTSATKDLKFALRDVNQKLWILDPLSTSRFPIKKKVVSMDSYSMTEIIAIGGDKQSGDELFTVDYKGKVKILQPSGWTKSLGRPLKVTKISKDKMAVLCEQFVLILDAKTGAIIDNRDPTLEMIRFEDSRGMQIQTSIRSMSDFVGNENGFWIRGRVNIPGPNQNFNTEVVFFYSLKPIGNGFVGHAFEYGGNNKLLDVEAHNNDALVDQTNNIYTRVDKDGTYISSHPGSFGNLSLNLKSKSVSGNGYVFDYPRTGATWLGPRLTYPIGVKGVILSGTVASGKTANVVPQGAFASGSMSPPSSQSQSFYSNVLSPTKQTAILNTLGVFPNISTLGFFPEAPEYDNKLDSYPLGRSYLTQTRERNGKSYITVFALDFKNNVAHTADVTSPDLNLEEVLIVGDGKFIVSRGGYGELAIITPKDPTPLTRVPLVRATAVTQFSGDSILVAGDSHFTPNANGSPKKPAKTELFVVDRNGKIIQEVMADGWMGSSPSSVILGIQRVSVTKAVVRTWDRLVLFRIGGDIIHDIKLKPDLFAKHNGLSFDGIKNFLATPDGAWIHANASNQTTLTTYMFYLDFKTGDITVPANIGSHNIEFLGIHSSGPSVIFRKGESIYSVHPNGRQDVIELDILDVNSIVKKFGLIGSNLTSSVELKGQFQLDNIYREQDVIFQITDGENNKTLSAKELADAVGIDAVSITPQPVKPKPAPKMVDMDRVQFYQGKFKKDLDDVNLGFKLKPEMKVSEYVSLLNNGYGFRYKFDPNNKDLQDNLKEIGIKMVPASYDPNQISKFEAIPGSESKNIKLDAILGALVLSEGSCGPVLTGN